MHFSERMSDIPPVSELKSMCTSLAPRTEPLLVRIYRSISIYITWILIHTPITANQVTVLSVSVTVSGSLFYIVKNPVYWILGFFIIQFSMILDCSDGEVARYRNTFNPRAELYSHIVTDAAIHVCVAVGAYMLVNSVILLGLGVTTGILLTYLHFVYPKTIRCMDHKKSIIGKALSWIGGLPQIIIGLAVLDIVFRSDYFRVSYVIIAFVIFLFITWKIFWFRQTEKFKSG